MSGKMSINKRKTIDRIELFSLLLALQEPW